MPRAVWRMLLGALILGVGAGCTPDFAPYWKIDDLRVMAIKADPVVAMPFEPVTLSALTYAPDDADIDYDWSWCPVRTSAADDFECPIDEEELEPLMEWADEESDNGDDDDGDMPDDFFDLGDGSEAVFVSPFEDREVRQFCEALQELFIEEFDDPAMADFLPGGDCSEGYEITVRLEVSTDDDSVIASKRFLLWGGADEVNENPVVDEIQLRPYDASDLDTLREKADWPVDEDAAHDEQWLSVSDDEPLSVTTDVALEWRALVDPDHVLTYTPPTPKGADEPPQPRTESYVYRHLTTVGTIDSSRRIFADDENTLEDASNTEFVITGDDVDDDCAEWRIDDGRCRIRLWTVVRDSRLGLDWRSATLSIDVEE